MTVNSEQPDDIYIDTSYDTYIQYITFPKRLTIAIFCLKNASTLFIRLC